MYEEKKAIKSPHTVIMENRKAITITGITDVDSFDEQTVIAFVESGDLTIRGNNLHVNKIDVQNGELYIEGEISSLSYSENKQFKGNVFSRIFR